MITTTERLQPERIPASIRGKRRFVIWNREERNGRSTKVPYRADAPGEKASATDPATWCTFDVALAAFEDGKCDGIGFVLGDGVVGIDLDKCRDPDTGKIEPWATEIIGALASYTEVSPSGTGVHILVSGRLPAGRRRSGNVETYSEARYFTLTGGHLPDTPLEICERTEALSRLHAQIFPAKEKNADPTPRAASPVADASDTDLVERACRGKNGDRFRSLWDGNWSGLYDSPSEADLALCNDLAFWAAGDKGRMDRLFRQSGLMRKKWEREDYRETTLQKAIDGAHSFYDPSQNGNGTAQPPPDESDGSGDGNEPLVLDKGDPHSGAREFLGRHFARNHFPVLYEQGGVFYAYNGCCYPELEEAGVRSKLWDFAAGAQRWRIPSKKDAEPVLVPYKPTTANVNNLLDATRALSHLPASVQAPIWLRAGKDDPPAAELIALQNGLLHVPTHLLAPHTPRFYTHNALDFAYDPALCMQPTQWLRFLDELWGDDEESIATLQEIIGYLLLPDTRQQKAFLLVGPPRSGKGTIARIIRALLGHANVCGPTLASLSGPFGLQALIGKLLAIISDARLSGRTDQAIIAERLLSISGEDAVTVDRKHLPSWTGRLPTRFLVLTNELPRLADASGALASRFVVLVLERSFYGKEDPGLTDRLLQELPGIFAWALDGWNRLQQRGYFVEPTSSADAKREMEDLGSPIAAFIRDRCKVEGGVSIECKRLYDAWKVWCEAEGRDHPGTAASFGRDLRAAVPGLQTSQVRIGGTGDRTRYYEGIALNWPLAQRVA